MKKLLLFLILPFSVQGMDKIIAVRTDGRTLRQASQPKIFMVKDFQGNIHHVKSEHTDAFMRSMSASDLRRMLEEGHGRLEAFQYTNGEWGLRSKIGVKGGGPVAAGIAYWVTKTLCYGTAVAAAGTIVVTTGGAAGAATGALVAAATTSATAGTAVAAGAIAGAGLSGEAAIATVGVVTAAGGVAGAVAAVETASLGVGAFFLALPIP